MEKAVFLLASTSSSVTVMLTLQGCVKNGYERMPPVEETLASYLSKWGRHPL